MSAISFLAPGENTHMALKQFCFIADEKMVVDFLTTFLVSVVL
jgi:hypothetical protein